jgi:flagellar biosynthesis GTPase FlhF
MDEKDNISEWSSKRVSEWLLEIGLSEYTEVFASEGVDGAVLLQLGDVEVHELVVGKAHRELLREEIKKLREEPETKNLPAQLGDWTTDDVVEWLRILGLDAYCDVIEQKRLSGFNLYYLTKKIMKEQLGIARIGDRVKLSMELNKLRETFNPDLVSPNDMRKRIEQVEMTHELVNVNTDTKAIQLNYRNWLEMKKSAARESYTPVMTFVGPTGCGKVCID